MKCFIRDLYLLYYENDIKFNFGNFTSDIKLMFPYRMTVDEYLYVTPELFSK